MITIPEYLWGRMLDDFDAERRQVEQVCYFDGVPMDGGGVVTTMTIPRARLEAGRFHVEPDAMSQAGKHLRASKLRRLAQVHTHPTEWTAHSPWDDEWAYSQLPGAVSIVLPYFARRRPTLKDAGIHLRSDAGWEQLSPAEVEKHVRIAPSILDFRSTNERTRLEPPRRRPWWSVLAFWRH